MVLLHGTLYVKLYEAKGLRDADGLNTNKLIQKHKKLAKFLRKAEDFIRSDVSDPYVTVELGPTRIIRSAVVNNNLNPVWNEEYEVVFFVKDHDIVSRDILGTVSLPAETIATGQPFHGWFPLADKDGMQRNDLGQMSIFVKLVPLGQDDAQFSVRSPAFPLSVPNTYFPIRPANNVILYQDAHVPPGALPSIPLDDGTFFKQRACWEDIYDTIEGARHLIYIAGWSVYTEIYLVRDPVRRPRESMETLGQLLKRKAAEGVSVNLLLWDDQTSYNTALVKVMGVMAVNDERTRVYFANTAVKVVLVPREGSGRSGLRDGQRVGRLIYTHHQKTLVCDAPGAHVSSRRLVAFLGGLDLCGGRWDTPEHPLFKTLHTYHKEDFRQKCIPGATQDNGGPREPWHDLHAFVDGPAAWDVLTNFTERWLKQAKQYASDLLDLTTVPGLVQYEPAVLRSIDSRSVAGWENRPSVANDGLVGQKGRLVERTIHDAHVAAIRRAQEFIYIESQYFLGSSQAWDESQSVKCNQLIPIEIALKICQKIRYRERFAAYVVIPLYPDGDPASDTEILHWQHLTMQAMYKLIAKEIRNCGLNAHPQEYLNFYWIGNREAPDGNGTPAGNVGPQQRRYQRSRRFMIYVHSKMMMVDDEYIILGSANVNQRSMDGMRDSEIAIGAYQPHRTMLQSGGELPRGHIHGFRMSLWAEHLGLHALPEVFLRPQSPECVQFVNSVARYNYDVFLRDAAFPLPQGHILPYPILVQPDGRVDADPRCVYIPDTSVPVLGCKSSTLPSDLTT
eukprot:jgi/Chlat1/4738/Chrsp300S00815